MGNTAKDADAKMRHENDCRCRKCLGILLVNKHWAALARWEKARLEARRQAGYEPRHGKDNPSRLINLTEKMILKGEKKL